MFDVNVTELNSNGEATCDGAAVAIGPLRQTENNVTCVSCVILTFEFKSIMNSSSV